MAKSSKKRERSDEDVADNHDAKPIVKKSKLDSTGKAEVTKKSSKAKEPKLEVAAVEEAPKAKKEKKEKKEKKDKKDKKEKKDKKDKKEKKEKKSKTADPAAESDEPAPEPETEEAANGDANTDKKSEKKKDKKKKTKKSKSAAADDDDETEKQQQADPEASTAQDDDNDNTTPTNGTTSSNGKQNRFICFVGNLPFTATADAVRAHFASLQPTSVRLLTQRDNPSKSRGIAFVEFGGYDHMKTCLKKFHHTDFDDGKSAPRKINVELTAGGGGKTAARQDKIKAKNAKLNEERAQRMKREEEAKYEKAMKGGQTQEQREEESIHPSRRGRVPYGRN